MRKKKYIDKVEKKHIARQCHFCPNDDYAVLDCHRIIPGELGGEYTEANTLVACACCHRLIHDGKIVVDRWYLSTAGWVLHYWDKEGEEQWR